uniref:Uncharacterized protein n=1 Tax=Caldiarchaeum subterraneum TaxID=311458 RepID=H1UCX7_CALS0|nr:hypothetical protein HGMM_F14A09C06 [Candidatus Caldarchaeum subterraneum]
MRFYADIHRLANKRRKNKTEEEYHVYTTDGVEFGKAERIADIPAKSGDELYVDVIPVELTDEFIGLLRRGVRVYRLRRLDLLPSHRNGSKSARNDVLAMMSMDASMFKEITPEFLEMTRLISLYRQISRSLVFTKQVMANFSNKRTIHPVLLELRRQKDRVARKIVELAKMTYPEFNMLTTILGINTKNSLYGKAALAILFTYVDFGRGLRKILCYAGIYRPNDGKYNKLLKEAAESLTISVKRRQRIKAKEIRQILKTIRTTLMAGGQA